MNCYCYYYYYYLYYYYYYCQIIQMMLANALVPDQYSYTVYTMIPTSTNCYNMIIIYDQTLNDFQD